MATWNHEDSGGSLTLSVDEHESLAGTVHLTVTSKTTPGLQTGRFSVHPFCLTPEKARALGEELCAYADQAQESRVAGLS